MGILDDLKKWAHPYEDEDEEYEDDFPDLRDRGDTGAFADRRSLDRKAEDRRNKVKNVVGKVALLESVGSLELLAAVNKQAEKLRIVQDILLEVNIGGEEAKSGFAPESLEQAAEEAKKCANVRVRGLMCIPPVAEGEHGSLPYFEKVHALFVDINAKLYDNTLDILSMGMSGDYEDAVRAGATMVRVGTAIFGARNYTI